MTHPMTTLELIGDVKCETCDGGGWIAKSIAVCCDNPRPSGECCNNPVEGQIQDTCHDCGGVGHYPTPPLAGTDLKEGK
jgi:DnaJ-class molecular chaperone